MSAQQPKMTMDRAARRYAQIRELERTIEVTDAEIKDANQHVKDAKDVLKELREARSTLVAALMKAARDEGELPLITLMDFEED